MRPQPELRSALLARSSFKGYLCRLGEAPEKNLRSRMPFWQPRHHLRCPLSSSSRPQPSQPALKNPRRRKSAAIKLLLSPRLRAKKGKANTGSCSSPATAVAICEGYPPGSNTSLSPSTTPAAEQTARSRVLTVPTLLTTFLRLDVRPPSSFGLSGRRLTSWLLRGMRSPPSFRGFQPPSECG